jgi:hypothetical protein
MVPQRLDGLELPLGVLAEGHGAGDIRYRRSTWTSKRVGCIGPEV